MVSTMKIVDNKKGALRAASAVGVRINRSGRRSYTLEYKLEVIRQCSELGVSVAGVALAHRINANLLRRWIVRHGRSAATAKPAATMLPVTIEAAGLMFDAGGDDKLGVSRKPNHAGTATIELELYGARMHLRGGVDGEVLRTVLAVLAQR